MRPRKSRSHRHVKGAVSTFELFIDIVRWRRPLSAKALEHPYQLLEAPRGDQRGMARKVVADKSQTLSIAPVRLYMPGASRKANIRYRK